MKVKDFIISFGIEKLKDMPIQQNGKTYKVFVPEDELEYHSLKNKDWGTKERMDSYHAKGNYRFYAIDENEMCIWVYPTTEIAVSTPSRTLYTGDLARLMYNTFTQNNTRTTHIPEAANCGGYYKEGATYIAYDFTNGAEVFMEQIDDENEAIRYALGQSVMIGGEEV